MSGPKSDENAVGSFKSTTSQNIRQPRQRLASNYLLVWIDASIDETNKDCQETFAQLKNVISHITLCTEPDRCIQVLNKVDKERAFVITSYSLGQHLVPEIHGMLQLEAIYIICGDKSEHQKWTQNWAKIKGVHTNMKDICQALQADVKQYNQDSIAMSFVTVNELASTYDSNQLEPTFMYTQIFKEILLDMEHGKQAIKDFITNCRQNECGFTVTINRFEKEYHAQSAIWWYTFTPFIYYMLNDGLRSMEGNTIINMGFFIHDLHQQIQQLYQQQVNHYHDKPFLVYRGQGLKKSNFEKLQKTKGGLMSFNNFLSTSKDKQVSLKFAEFASMIPDMVAILFVMSIDPCIKSTPFASIKEMSAIKEQEEEILFSMHAVFRVNAIKQIDNNDQLYQVELQLTSDDDQQLRILTDRIREEASGTEWQRLGVLLLKIGQFNKAEELYKVLLEHTLDEDEKAYYYHQLGYVKNDQGDYKKAIWYYEQGLEIKQKTLPSNHPELATPFNNIGSVYDNMGEYSKALSFYEKALGIYQETLPSDHPDLATSYSNIGLTYSEMGEYSKALSYYEKVFEILKNTLPSNHPYLATSYSNIGNVHNKIGKHSKALSFYEKVLEIKQKTLPSNHHQLATSYNNTGSVHDFMGEYSKALSFYEKALEIRQKTLSSNHPDLATSYDTIGLVYNHVGEYSKALSYYEKALEIREKSLPLHHPDLATTYNNIGSVYDSMGEYSKTRSYYDKALEILKKTLPLNHPDLANLYNNIGNVHNKMEEYFEALSYYDKALEILKNTVPSNHPYLATLYSNIGSVFDKIGEYRKALSLHEKALEIYRNTLPSNHPLLATSYNNSGFGYYNMKDYSKALSYLERALDILQSALPLTHPHIKSVKESIEIVKKKL
ncbi:unnamed protein product [Adineta steineri]|uniref:NAD(P)(+)--arginine ADP-ribosyltransferase n=1 Tax=Adineta steineri TaxID=433720 RepID=A0A816DQQ7_9BILA|nr:unnamed protein product [Adineta steineri]CAF1640240.1 unnamed protein product [Adineta steineri]